MMMVIFDLDGTLLDTSPGILECVRYASEKLGYPELPHEKLLTFIGPPLKDSFMRCYGCDEAEAERLTATYREHYRKGALLNAIPYNGILELCETLKAAGVQLAVATSKPQAFSEQVLRHFGFDRYLDVIFGADMAGHLSKADLIRQCVGDKDPSACVMVGDTDYDAIGAQEANVPFLAVSYGFGNKEKMLSYPHIGIAEKPMDIIEILADHESLITRN